MPLGYKKVPGEEGYYYTSGGTKYVRVIMGAAIPLFDRMSGAALIIGELYRPGGPPAWQALDAALGIWGEVTAAMAQFRQDYKFNYVVVDTKEHRNYLTKIRGMDWGMDVIPWAGYAAPAWAFSEVGRAYTDGLIREGRLAGVEKGTAFVREMEKEMSMGYMALNFATAFASEYPAFYTPVKRYGERGAPRRILGVEGL